MISTRDIQIRDPIQTRGLATFAPQDHEMFASNLQNYQMELEDEPMSLLEEAESTGEIPQGVNYADYVGNDRSRDEKERIMRLTMQRPIPGRATNWNRQNERTFQNNLLANIYNRTPNRPF